MVVPRQVIRACGLCCSQILHGPYHKVQLTGKGLHRDPGGKKCKGCCSTKSKLVNKAYKALETK